MTDVLARKDRALSPEETEALLRDRLGDQVVGSTVEFGTFTLHIAPSGWHAAAQLCRDESLLAYDMFDCLFGIDAREEGFDVVAVLYSTSVGTRICLRTRCEGGRDAPVCPSITDVYRGADWMERETYDMFGIDFEGHPSVEPRLLTVENFEGWPLRKDFHLTSRVAKSWPGVKEPAELDDEGNVIERIPEVGDAPGPYDLDKAMAEQARAINKPELDEGDADQDEADKDASAAKDDGDERPATEIDQETFDKLIAEGKSERIARSKAKAAFMKKQKAAAAAGDAPAEAEAEDAPTDGIDKETFDRLIAEGKSERIARSKAKAAFIKKQRAAEAADADDTDAAEGAPPDQDVEVAEQADESADAEVEATEEEPAKAPADEEPTAAEKAEARRKEQAEARKRKAEERAAEAEAGDADGDEPTQGPDDEEGQA